MSHNTPQRMPNNAPSRMAQNTQGRQTGNRQYPNRRHFRNPSGHAVTNATTPRAAKAQPTTAVMRRIKNFLILLTKPLGQGQFGKVYLAQQFPNEEMAQALATTNNSPDGKGAIPDIGSEKLKGQVEYCACKVVEKNKINKQQELSIVNEIMNQESINSPYVVRLRRAIKTDSRYYIFIDYCNGGDMKELMELKRFNVDPKVIHKFMRMLVQGCNDMIAQLVIHRDLKLQNIMLNFPNNQELHYMNKQQKLQFLRDVDLQNTTFEIKIADFGFSKKLKWLQQANQTLCGTPLYMAPQILNKNEYTYKADIWSVGVILFELVNTQTPFHSRNRPEFESKVKSSMYKLRSASKDILTLECALFLSQCLQHNEQERKEIEELMLHPYIVKEFDQQMQIGDKHMDMIFSPGQGDGPGTSKIRSSSASMRQSIIQKENQQQKENRASHHRRAITLIAKDNAQMMMIQKAITQKELNDKPQGKSVDNQSNNSQSDNKIPLSPNSPQRGIRKQQINQSILNSSKHSGKSKYSTTTPTPFKTKRKRCSSLQLPLINFKGMIVPGPGATGPPEIRISPLNNDSIVQEQQGESTQKTQPTDQFNENTTADQYKQKTLQRNMSRLHTLNQNYNIKMQKHSSAKQLQVQVQNSQSSKQSKSSLKLSKNQLGQGNKKSSEATQETQVQDHNESIRKFEPSDSEGENLDSNEGEDEQGGKQSKQMKELLKELREEKLRLQRENSKLKERQLIDTLNDLKKENDELQDEGDRLEFLQQLMESNEGTSFQQILQAKMAILKRLKQREKQLQTQERVIQQVIYIKKRKENQDLYKADESVIQEKLEQENNIWNSKMDQYKRCKRMQDNKDDFDYFADW